MMEYTADYEQRKRDMKELWKETFHDSDRYVDLVFDTYFSLENTFVRYHENRLIAAMLTVGYEFQILTKEGKIEQFKGVYLCGLATRSEWRKRGIMAELMMEAEEAARSRGFNLAFLIPADDHLREYYFSKGYHTVSRRIPETFICHRGDLQKAEDLHIYSVKDLWEKGKLSFLVKLAEWCREIEKKRQHDTIVHSRQDMLAIMEENEHSIILTNDSFDPEYPILAKVVAVAFPELPDSAKDPLRVVGLYKRNEWEEKGQYDICEDIHDIDCSSNIRQVIMDNFRIEEMQIMMPDLNRKHEKGDGFPYAMMKPLDEKANSLKIENRAIEISLMLD